MSFNTNANLFARTPTHLKTSLVIVQDQSSQTTYAQNNKPVKIWSSKLRDNNGRKNTLVTRSYGLSSDA